MTKKSISLLRDLLKNEFPIFPGTNYSKPAPMHIVNAVSRVLIGPGQSVSTLEKFRSRTDDELFSILGSGESSEEERSLFVRTLDGVFNSDRRAFSKNFVSFLPITDRFIGQDPSDDGYGRNLVEAWDSAKRMEIKPLIGRLLDGQKSNDPMTQFANLLDQKFEASDQVNPKTPPAPEFTVSSNFADAFFPVIRDSLTELWEDEGKYGRVPALQSFSFLLGSLLSIGLLFDPAKYELETTRPKTGQPEFGIGEVVGVVVYTGTPPGPPRDSLVRLSQVSLRDFVKRSHDGIRLSLLKKFNCDESIVELNKEQIETVVNLSAVPRSKVADFASMLDNLRKVDSGADFLNDLFSFDELRSSLSSLGRKVGFVGPQRGGGESRLVVETPLLDSLVRSIGSEGSSLEDFVDSCYDRTGLIVGRPRNIHTSTKQRLDEMAGRTIDVGQSLNRAHQLLDERLVRAGLAQKFSDGATVLRHK